MPYKDPRKGRATCKKNYSDKKKDPAWRESETRRIKEYRRLNPNAVKNAALKRKFGIDIDAYEKLFEEQSGVCAVCKVSFVGTIPNVDHNHTTNKVRGLLCMSCNIALGHVKDSVEVLESAIEYLKKYKES
jgi:hypothetical protein